MSYTENIKNQALCNYINPMKDNAEVMLKRCINDNNFNCPDNCPGPLNFKDRKNQPTINYGFPDVYPQNMSMETLGTLQSRRNNIKNENYDLINYLNNNGNDNSVNNNGNDNSVNNNGNDNSVNNNGNDIVEGFKSGDFLSDNGPGKQFISGCPDEYEYDELTKRCVKICDNCNPKVKDINFGDVCRPYHYDGIDNFGSIMCSSKIDILGNTYINSTELYNVKSFRELRL
jgi:hypothetical protein